MITICDILDAPKLQKDYDFVISIHDAQTVKKYPYDFGEKHLSVYFEDEMTGIKQPPKQLKEVKQSLQKILEWSQQKIQPQDRVLVHCHYGISRSAAVAWLLLIQQGQEPREAFLDLLRSRPLMWPNLTVMRYGDALLGKGGRLYQQALNLDEDLRKGRLDYIIERC